MKKFLSLLVVTVLVFTLVSCSSGELESISILGTRNRRVVVGQEVNVLDGISVVGDNQIDYTDYLSIHSFACGVDDNNNLYTDVAKTCDITYIAVVEGKYAKESVTITIE